MPAFAGNKTIVGYWKIVGSQCIPSAGSISIGPKSLVGDEMVCQFATVARSGNAVTWTGGCEYSDGSTQKVKVRATENGGVLSVAINGNMMSDYKRCSKAESSGFQ